LHRREGRRLRALVAAAVILVLGFTAVLILSPTARTAVARFLGLRGVRITVQPTVSVPPVHPGEHLALGQRMSLFEAGSKLPFRVLLPPDHVEGIALGAPDAVYLDPYLPTGKVTLVYGERPGLPKTKETGVGMLLAEFRGTLDEPSLQKSIRFGDATVESVVVNGEQGYFIRGEHAVEYREPSGLTRQDTVRLAGNTLLWERDGVTFRLESSLSKARALAIAERIA